MFISRYFIYFILFSFMGWIYETIYCTVKGGKWENRGFLYGPICPIYGAGAVSITAIMDFLTMHSESGQLEIKWWQIFIIAFLGSIVLEYSTSWILEKLFHAYWWDYRDMPLNINGRVCFPASFGFGVAGVLVTYYIGPFIKSLVAWMSPEMYELVALIFMMIIAADTTLTISSITKFERYVVSFSDVVNNHMDSFVNIIQEKTHETRDKLTVENVKNTLLEEKDKFTAENIKRMIIEEKENFSLESIKGMALNIGRHGRAAISRVKGFRNPKFDEEKANIIVEEMKKVSKRKKK